MAIKLFGKSITSAYKSVVSTVSKNVSKVTGGSSSKSSSTKSKSSSSGNKTSGSSKSSSVSKVSSTTKQSTTTKYVTNAAAIYNASGKKVSVPSSISTGRPAQSYVTQAKASTTNSKKSTGSATTAKITTAKTKTVASSSVKSTSNKVPSSISTGRPAQSYATQAKASKTNSQKSTGSATTAKITTAKTKTVVSSSVKSTSNKVPSSISTGRPAQSYATQAKASKTNNQKTVKTASGNKTMIGPQNRTTNSAISTGRPKESYISQQKASTAKGQATAQTKLPVPVAQKAPTSKKDPSEASYSNNRPKQSYTHVVTYKPSPSREGTGQMVYTTKTDPKGAKAGASFATSCIPYVGDAKDIQEAVTGKDLITGKKLTGGERAITITAAVLPVVSSPMLKGAAKGGKVAVKEAPNAVKKAGTFIKKNAPEVKNVTKNADVAKDTEKAMKKKAVEKAKDAKKSNILKLQKKADEAAQEYNAKYNPSNRVINKGYKNIIKTPNGGVSFSDSNYIHKINDVKTKTQIEATGSRNCDFDVANAKFGFKDVPDGYVWHHVDDYNVEKNTFTLELVRGDAHNAAKPHSGACAQYDAVHGPSYNPRRKGSK